jgi:hypothetical protein
MTRSYKMGAADNIEPEPRIGTRRNGWVKVRHLGREAWGKAVCDGVFDAMFSTVTEDHLRAMGYEREIPT